MTQRSSTLPQYLEAIVPANSFAMNTIIVIAASLLIALSAQIAVPLPAVPMTLQPLAVLLVGAALGHKRGFAAGVAYLAEGAVGLPFFAHGTSGLPILLGTTGGYLIAFPFAAALAGYLSEKGAARNVFTAAISMSLPLALIHLIGATQLAMLLQLTASQAFAMGVAPFLIGDAVKVAIAALLLPAARKAIASGRNAS